MSLGHSVKRNGECHVLRSRSLPYACLIWSYAISTHSRNYSLHSHGSRIALFSAALPTQIFGPKEFATVTTLGVECFILVLFGIMSSYVMQLFFLGTTMWTTWIPLWNIAHLQRHSTMLSWARRGVTLPRVALCNIVHLLQSRRTTLNRIPALRILNILALQYRLVSNNAYRCF